MSKGEASIKDEESKPSFKRQMKSEQQQDWTDLPKEFWIPIMEKLPWSERVRLSLVCKTWKQCIQNIQNTQEFLPWLMCYEWQATEDGRVDSICKLGDPYARKLYTVEETTKGREREIFVGAVPCASSQGWLLFSKISHGRKHLFLYSPFTDEVIGFPELETGWRDRLPDFETSWTNKASFSLNPSSPDCVVIAFSIPQSGKLEIKTCHPGDESWETLVVSGEYIVLGDVGYADESFYVVFSQEMLLGAFNVKQREWKLWNLQSGPLPQIPQSTLHLVVAFNGDLILSCCKCGHIPCGIWRFDLLKGERAVVENEVLEKQVIFKGCRSFSSISVPANGNARESAGRINYFSYFSTTPQSFVFNCLSSRIYPTTPKDYEWMLNNNDLRKIWIRPPLQGIWRAYDLLQSARNQLN